MNFLDTVGGEMVMHDIYAQIEGAGTMTPAVQTYLVTSESDPAAIALHVASGNGTHKWVTSDELFSSMLAADITAPVGDGRIRGGSDFRKGEVHVTLANETDERTLIFSHDDLRDFANAKRYTFPPQKISELLFAQIDEEWAVSNSWRLI